MCLAVPAKVLRKDNGIARVDFGGVERDVCVDLIPEVEEGDYVLVHAGFAIQRLDAEEAGEVIALIREALDAHDAMLEEKA